MRKRHLLVAVVITLCVFAATACGSMVEVTPSSYKSEIANRSTVFPKLLPKYVKGELIVKLNSDSILAKRGQINQLQRRIGAKTVAKVPRQDIELWHVKQPLTLAQNTLLQSGQVEYAERNYIVHTVGAVIPNDPHFADRWGMNNTGPDQSGGSPDADIDAPEAWEMATGSSSVVVGVIDTGCDYNHEDLKDNIWSSSDGSHGYDWINNDNDPMDDQGHGTHVSGTIGAEGNNGIGVSGVNWDVSIACLKFIGSDGRGNAFDAIKALEYAGQHGIRITSNSWGGGGYLQSLHDAICNFDGVFVAAAGNNGYDNDVRPFYPASYDCPNLIAVAASDSNDYKAGFSNYGLKSVDLAAPGVDDFSTVPTGKCPLCDTTGYRELDGTSMATPHVAGAVALLRSHVPQLSVQQTIDRVFNTVDKVTYNGINYWNDKVSTGGRLNVAGMLKGAPMQLPPQPIVPPPPPPPPTPPPPHEVYCEGFAKCLGTPKTDLMYGDLYANRMYGLGGQDGLDGSGGNDLLVGGTSFDYMLGGIGNDRLLGGNGGDREEGQDGDDRLSGSRGNDHLLGQQGNDSLKGDTGNDVLDAGDGNDDLRGGPGSDSLLGGKGNDHLIDFDGSGQRYDCGAGEDWVVASLADKWQHIVVHCEHVRYK